MGTPIKRNTRVGLVTFLNEKGLKLDDDQDWLNFSQWGTIDGNVSSGDTVEVTVDGQGWIRKLVIVGKRLDEHTPNGTARRPSATAPRHTPAELSGKPEPRPIRPRLEPADPEEDWAEHLGEEAWSGPDDPTAGVAVAWPARAAALHAAIALIGLHPDADRDPASVLAVADGFLSWLTAAE